MLIALDTETTGRDLYHSCRPYFVTICQPDGTQIYYEWDVDPLTREPVIPRQDILDIDLIITGAEELVLQNGKFDVTALQTIHVNEIAWPWHRTHDTLLAAHLLGSNRPKDLTSLGITYLGRNIQHLEDTLGEATKAARRMARSKFKDWRIAKAGMEELPSAKKSGNKADDKLWKNDAWLPRAIAQECNYPVPAPDCHHDWDTDYLCKKCEGCSWWILLRDYANADSAVTLAAWQQMKAEMKRRGLWRHYLHRRKLPQITYEMERRGVTQSKSRTEALEARYQEESYEYGEVCLNIAKNLNYTLELPNGASPNDSLRNFCIDVLKLEPFHSPKAKTDKPSLDKYAIEHYLLTLDAKSQALRFIQRLIDKRKRDTALGFLAAYQRFWIKAEGLGDDWYILHPSYNITGSDTLRFSCSNPNTQQISKKGMYEGDKSNIRECFGPDPGGEWWSLDAKNIELRIPFYKSGEQTLIDLFERPDDPPYYGSNHLANFHAVYPDIWDAELREVGFEKVGPHCKKKYASTWYQYCKNGGFCVPLDTEALTRQGWRKHDELQAGDEVLGYKDGTLQWTRVKKVLHFSHKKLLKIGNRQFQAITTPDHEWVGKKREWMGGARGYVDNFCRSDSITSDQTIILSAPVVDKSKLDLTEDECALLGFVYGDGHINKSTKARGPSRGAFGLKIGFSVKVFQSKPAGVEYLEDLLIRWGELYKKYTRKSDGGYVYVLSPSACRSIWKRAGIWDSPTREAVDFEKLVLDMGPAQRTAFLDGVFAAEGHYSVREGRNPVRHIGQNAGRFCDGIFLAMFMCGKFPSRSKGADYRNTGKLNQTMRECKPYVTGQRIKTEHLPGLHDVWCVETELDSWVIRQAGRIMLTGNCKQYGGQKRKTDATFRRNGAFDLLESKFSKLTQLNRQVIAFARKHGYVETLPSKFIDPAKGYPLLCTRNDYGGILETVPLSYMVQGTAMEYTCTAMIRTEECLAQWRKEGFDAWMVLQVHDELVFRLPRADNPKTSPRTSNLARVMELKRLMELGGDDIGIPIPVGAEWHDDNWSTGVAVA